MSTQTEHLGLHQWEAGDCFLRSDFNEDFAKIDAGVKAAQALAESACATGQYTVTEDKAQVDIQLGFRPKLVLLFARNYSSGKLCYITDSIGTVFSYDVSSKIFYMYTLAGRVTDQGFTIDQAAASINQTVGLKVYYAAFR